MCKSGEKEYVLYRGLKNTGKIPRYYKDEYPSSWSRDVRISKKFSCGKTNKIMKIRVPSDSILMDLDWLENDYEKEVILFPGTYEIQTVDRAHLKDTKKDLIDKCKKMGIEYKGMDYEELEEQIEIYLRLEKLRDVEI
jgi:hypothetical protein